MQKHKTRPQRGSSKQAKNRVLTESDVNNFTLQVANQLWEGLDTPVSLACWLIANEGDFEQLVNKTVNPSHYLAEDVDQFRKDYQAVSLLSKAMVQTGIDTKSVALKKWYEAEEQCRITNAEWDERRKAIGSTLLLASYLISKVLGKVPSCKELPYRFGPGSTLGIGGSLVSLDNKIAYDGIQCSRQAIPYVLDHLTGAPLLLASRLGIDEVSGVYTPIAKMKVQLCEFNRLAFVPKSAKTDRGIAVEPHDMVPTQLALGTFIRGRLKRVGVDLNSQRQNRALAYLGSLDGSYATIDLSSASDTISYRLVMDLIPPEWFEILSSLRCTYTQLPDGTYHENDKFSSMGNGFTFELESLIFWALAKACTQQSEETCKEPSVYGDDIIVDTRVASEVINVLGICGLTANVSKTFISGVFRESCGYDYFNGHMVRPYFLKNGQEVLKYETDKFKVANGLRHAAVRSLCNVTPVSWLDDIQVGKHDNTLQADPVYRGAWSYCIRSVKKEFRFFGPGHLGDSVIWCPLNEALDDMQGCKVDSSLPSGKLRFEIPGDFGGNSKSAWQITIRGVQNVSRANRWDDWKEDPYGSTGKVTHRRILTLSAKRVLSTYGCGPTLAVRGTRYPRVELVHPVHWDRDSGSWAY